MEHKLLSTAEAAALLRVGASSVKRWADEDLLNCVRTAGGHRRFRRQDVEQFRARGMAGAETLPESAPEATQRLVDRLVADEEPMAVVALLMEARARQGSWWAVADQLGAVLEELGRRWEQGEQTVMEEHAASARLARALAWCAGALPVPAGAGKVLLCTADGDEHTLGLSLVELCVREAGWMPRWSGAGTPREELREAVAGGQVAMVVVSASLYSSGAEALREQALELAEAARHGTVALVLGGRGAWPEELPGVHRLRDFSALQALCARLAR